VASASSLQLATNGTTTAVTIDTNQNVGVGVTPAAKFNIGSGGAARFNRSDNSSIIYAEIVYAGSGVGLKFTDTNADGFRFFNASTQIMTLDTNGNLLVGYTSGGQNSFSGLIKANAYNTKAGAGATLGANGFNINWTGSPYLWIDTTNVGQLSTVSDYRLKENVIPQTASALDRVAQLHPVQFNRKTVGIFGGSTDIEEGFIAHELQAIIPSAVYGNKDALTENGEIQPQSLNWSPIASVLVKAIQELAAQVTTLQTQVTALKG
jgi:hypothetical protein